MSDDHDDPRLGRGDREIISASIEGKGILLTPDALEGLAKVAGATMRHFEEAVAGMDRDQARFVRQLRVDKGYSWRAVAETFQLQYSVDCGDGNQLAGMAVCERAAEFFGENYMAEPWN